MGLPFRLDRASSFLQYIFQRDVLPRDFEKRIILTASDGRSQVSTRLQDEMILFFLTVFPGLTRDDMLSAFKQQKTIIPHTFDALEKTHEQLRQKGKAAFVVTDPALAIAVRVIEMDKQKDDVKCVRQRQQR
jgi:hypothetical protein